MERIFREIPNLARKKISKEKAKFYEDLKRIIPKVRVWTIAFTPEKMKNMSVDEFVNIFLYNGFEINISLKETK